MTARDYLAEAENALERAELDQYEDVQTRALLGIGQQLRRIADTFTPDPEYREAALKAMAETREVQQQAIELMQASLTPQPVTEAEAVES